MSPSLSTCWLTLQEKLALRWVRSSPPGTAFASRCTAKGSRIPKPFRFRSRISAALFTALSGRDTTLTAMSDLFLGRTDNVAIRFAAAVALLFNVLMVIISVIAIIVTVPKDDTRAA